MAVPPTGARLLMSHRSICFFLTVLGFCQLAAAEDTPLHPRDVQFFENRIRPVLVKHCYQCHSKDAKEIGGKLLLDSREGLLKGGESGAAVVAGKPDSSLIVQALKYDGLEMPPEKRLPDNVVADFVEWVKRGAADPRSDDGDGGAKGKLHDEESLWAFRPPTHWDVPAVKDEQWPRNDIDRFVLAKIEDADLKPAADADARMLIRRLSIDLIGLPPSFDQIESFVSSFNTNPDAATAALVDDLLASPQFGERWGRHWLDVARYAESNGNDGLSRNPTFPHAWRFRDYVIESLNQDTAYDRFLTEQIAGDLLPAESDEQRDRNLVATGFLAMAAKPAKAMNNNFDMDIVADQIDVVGRGVMAISVGCARCHDHKFDPVPMNEYYALAGIFTSTETMWGPAAHEKLTAPATDLHVLKAAAKVPPPPGFVEAVRVPESNTGKPKPIPKSKWPVGTPLAMGARDKKKLADCKLNIKGDAKKLGKAVPRGFLSACRFESKSEVTIDPKQSGRLQLAKWLTQTDHPLTSRVLVNRVWHHLFGQGIVSTPDDFGVYGERPTHPKLLDHLAIRFVGEGWSIKKLIRNIVLSRTYRLSSFADEATLRGDDGNRLLTRHRRRRLDCESLRDSMLFASGQLNLQPRVGSLVQHRNILVNIAGNLHQPSNHRSVYLCYLRSSPPPELAAFDLPDFTSVVGRRDVSTVPNQALHLYNSPFVVQQADHLAERVTNGSKGTEDVRDKGEGKSTRIETLWQLAFGRQPTDDEAKEARAMLKSFEEKTLTDKQPWTILCQALLLTNEFRYVD